MLSNERQQFILQQLQKNGVVRVSELASALEVNPVTIRRDLAHLEDQGHLSRVHGGAVSSVASLSPISEIPVSWKGRIAEAAAKFIPDQNTVFIGPGELTPEVVPFLVQKENLTIITNALDVAWTVKRLNSHTLHIIGGQVAEDCGIYGNQEAFTPLRADWVILEVAGLDAESGVTHDHRDYAEMARRLFGLGAQVMILLSPRRVGRSGALYIAPADEVDVLVTGREASNPPLWYLSELGVRIVLA